MGLEAGLGPTLLGLGVFLGLVVWAWRRQSFRWRMLAAAYAATSLPPLLAERRMLTVIVRDPSGLWTTYGGTVIVGVAAEGLVMRQPRALAWGYPDLFLPYDELSGRETSWHLNARSYALCPTRSSLVVVVDHEVLDWLTTASGRQLVS